MRIYNRTDFMKLPAGTIYCKGKPWLWGQISIKGETTAHNDFLEMDLATFDNDSSEDWMNKQEDMLRNGASYPLTDDYYGRDGCFDNDDIFLVYETGDLQTLKVVIESALSVSRVNTSQQEARRE